MCKKWFTQIIWPKLNSKSWTRQFLAHKSPHALCRLFTKYAFSRTDLGSKHFLVTSFEECSSQVVTEAELQGKLTVDLLFVNLLFFKKKWLPPEKLTMHASYMWWMAMQKILCSYLWLMKTAFSHSFSLLTHHKYSTKTCWPRNWADQRA